MNKEADTYFEQYKNQKFDVNINVNNSTYSWDAIEITRVKHNGVSYYQLMTKGNPKVANRRMHPRLPMNNSCDILLKSQNINMKGTMVNISAGGYAFACDNPALANAVGEKVQLTIHGFTLTNGAALPAKIIRSTFDQGRYIVGCRLPVDSVDIQKYVEERMKKG